MKNSAITLTITYILFAYTSIAQENNRLISDFYQGTVEVSREFQQCSNDYILGNCATIALIKAAIIEFNGIDNIFQSISYSGDTIYATFNKEKMVIITKDERELVKKLSGILKTDNAIYYEDAITIYTLICKRVLEIKEYPDCVTNFKQAVEYVNSGYPTKTVCGLLELNPVIIKTKDIKKYSSVIIWSNAHASFCNRGKQDILGREYNIRNRWMKNPRGLGGLILGALRVSK